MSLSADGTWKAGVWATTVWADGVWLENATQVIGKRRRRGRSRARIEEIVNLVEQGAIDRVAKENAEAVIEQARIIASAKTDLEIAKSVLKRGKDRSERLTVLEARLNQAEEQMVRLIEEEELIFILALAV